MAAQRKSESGQGAKKRRRYIHFEALLFLIPYVCGRETSSNISQSENPEQEHCPEATGSIQDSTSTNASSLTTDKQARPPARPNKSVKQRVTSYESELLNILKARQSDELNEDKNFALMLVPMLGRLSDDQKHYAKVEILNVMRNAKYYNPKPQQVQPNYVQSANPVQYSQNNGDMLRFYNQFSESVVSPSSACGSDLYDLSSQ